MTWFVSLTFLLDDRNRKRGEIGHKEKSTPIAEPQNKTKPAVVYLDDTDQSSYSDSDANTDEDSESDGLGFTKRRKISGEAKVLVTTAVPASKPSAQLPNNLRRGRQEDMPEVAAKLTTVHSTFDEEKTSTYNRHMRRVNSTKGILKAKKLPQRTLADRMALDDDISPPASPLPLPQGQSLSRHNLMALDTEISGLFVEEDLVSNGSGWH
jgi:hypothetical protein